MKGINRDNNEYYNKKALWNKKSFLIAILT